MNKVLGIRLHNLEIYNWGTFDKAIWRFNPEGHTSLLTGDSGSGKSTIVDALSTLLVQPRRLAYNKAADASAKERTAKSYVLGYYGRKYAHEGKGKPEKLRDEKNYSVILATFKDEVRNKTTSLAVFFWFKDNDPDPSKLYVVSEREMFIAEDFSRFGSDVKVLRNRLRQKGAKVFDSFSNYGEFYRKCLGGVSEQAIDLFQQTISMKKVEALNEFVRDSMLEKEDIHGEIDELLKHYANLNSAYEAVVKAKNQIEKLTPIHEKGQQYLKKTDDIATLNRAINSNEIWFAGKYKSILAQQIFELEQKKEKINYKIRMEEENQSKIKSEIKIIENNINQNGGNELAILESEVKNKEKEYNSKKYSLERYNEHANCLGLKPGIQFEDYNANRQKLPQMKQELENKSNELQEKLVAIGLGIEKYKESESESQAEIKSLSQRTSNIPSKLIELRENLCSDMKIDASEIAFAGELLEVKQSEIQWEGAIERLVHSFAISILVPEKHYASVSKWVNQRNLGTKLVYFKVGKDSRQQMFHFEDAKSVASKLMVKQDSVFAQWLTNELSQRFPHICCDTLDDFRRQSKAITIHGQIRSGQRHEKDDRHNIKNRMRYVLGFSNKKKIEALERELSQIKEQIRELNAQNEAIKKEKKNQDNLLRASDLLMEYSSHETIDVLSVERVISEKKERILQINRSNDVLTDLEKQKIKKEEELESSKKKIDDWNKQQGKLEFERDQLESKQNENEEKLKKESEEDRNIYDFLERDFTNYLEKKSIALTYNEKHEKAYNSDLIKRNSSLQEKAGNLKNEVEKSMMNFKREYPIETFEMTDEMESLKEYSDMLNRLLYDNLPKYQAHFKNELQGKIIRHISLLHATLHGNSKKIAERIAEINQSLKSIPYNIGRYITLNCEDTVEQDIRNFKTQLKSCTEGMTAMDDALIENKFKQIKDIIGRFKGRPEFLEADKRWTAKVTDVRNWFIFSATERYLENDEEYEHYSDSDGKSGGQKEKLAYTILAASLAYNYKLNKKENQGSSFRLVVIDEAFLKSSDESAKFGLSLFEKMRFQLLVVTPLLKISTIEPFISHVGFVSHNDITHISQLKNISIEDYRRNRKQWEEKGFEKMD
ncbi:MAG: ATP-binding protein [Peptostreptococcaceae bacterium]|nr:ATP-binding protein [Peptostreptococcaceae bacterium]